MRHKLRFLVLVLQLSSLTPNVVWPQQSKEDLKKCSANAETNPDVAIHFCSSVIESVGPHHGVWPDTLARARISRGIAYAKKGQYDRAIQDFDVALQLNPHSAFAFNNRGLAYLDKGENDRAVQDFDRALHLDPVSAPTFLTRGIAFANQGQFDRAIMDYDEAIRLSPRSPSAFNNRGFAYLSKGEYDRAIQDFNQAINLKSDSAVVFNNRGLAYLSKSEFDRAVQDFDQAIRLQPDFAYAFYCRGIVLFSLEKFPAAHDDFAKSLQLKPKEAYFAIGLYLAQARAGHEAKDQLAQNTAKSKSEEWPGKVIELYLGKATPDEVLAVANVSGSQKQASQRCEANFYVGELALLRGNREEAIQFFRKATATESKADMQYMWARSELAHLKAPQ